MALKCKAVAKSTDKVFGGSKRKVETTVNEEPEVEESEEEMEDEEEEEELNETQIAAKKKQHEKGQEKETAMQREKELKSMYVDDLKKLVERLGLQIGKRDDMMKAVLKFEAKERADVREKEAKIRDVVVAKKEAFETVGASELKKLCVTAGIGGSLSKPERVEQLLTQWLHNDGVNKTLQDLAHEKRESELMEMDKPTLRKLCDKACIDHFLKDVLIDRIVRHETAEGKFLRPAAAPVQEAEPKTTSKKIDMVEAILAKGKETEEAAKIDVANAEAVAKRLNDLKGKSMDDLKKLLKRKGLDNSGKKDVMVRLLYEATVEEESLVARKAELKSMDKDALAKLLSTRGLETSGSRDKMVDAVITHEATVRQELKAFDAKLIEAAAKKKTELAKLGGAELKELCAKKGLAVGGANEDKINRLAEAAQKEGELDEVVVKMNRDARRGALSGMEKLELVKLCESLGVDALVKEVMVERILTYEAEGGEPVAKRARK